MPQPPVFHMIRGAAQPVAPYSHAVEVGNYILDKYARLGYKVAQGR